MDDFSGFAMPKMLHANLAEMQYQQPTPIQAKAIPLALEGQDILGSAQTGTGKTAAFLIPAISYLLRNQEESAIILAPTRELAMQVMTVSHAMLGKQSGIRSTLLIGGAPMQKQFQELRRSPRLIIGTPGRINDHLRRKSLHLSNASFLILDEMDRMLDLGFGVQIDDIVQHMPNERQTLMFSATLPKEIEKLSKKYMSNATRVSVDNVSRPAAKIKQTELRVGQRDKYQTLLNELQKREGTVVMFVKTRRDTETIAEKLAKDGIEAEPIHGELRQKRRDNTIKAFRNQKFRVLVATDVAARGLDIPHIAHVINYDLPQVAEDYIHRIGRTARAGAEGEALCLIAPHDEEKWYEIAMLLDPNAKIERPRRMGKSKPKRFGGKGGGGGKSFGGGGGAGGRRDGKSFGGGGNGKPFKRREGGSSEGKPFKRREEGGSSEGGKPFKRREGGHSDGKPFKRRDEGSSEGQPFKRREGAADAKPYKQKRPGSHTDAGGKPKFEKRSEGGDKPFKRRDEGSSEGHTKTNFKKRKKPPGAGGGRPNKAGGEGAKSKPAHGGKGGSISRSQAKNLKGKVKFKQG